MHLKVDGDLRDIGQVSPCSNLLMASECVKTHLVTMPGMLDIHNRPDGG